MKREEIDQLLEAAQAEAVAKGDDSFRPGAITFNSATWVRMSMTHLPTTCVSVKVGIRYRGISVLISSQRNDGVLTRGEAGEAGEPFYELEPRG